MPDDVGPQKPATGGNGNRNVTNNELEILSLKIENKLDKIVSVVTAIQAWQLEYRDKIDRNKDDIQELRTYIKDETEILRTRSHEHANQLQVVMAKTEPLDIRIVAEFVRLLPWAQEAQRLFVKREVSDLPTPDETHVLRALVEAGLTPATVLSKEQYDHIAEMYANAVRDEHEASEVSIGRSVTQYGTVFMFVMAMIALFGPPILRHFGW